MRKHGVAFEMAREAFDDPFGERAIANYVNGEERLSLIGVSRSLTLLVVIYTTWYEEPGDTEVVRIISARYADRHERRRYEEG